MFAEVVVLLVVRLVLQLAVQSVEMVVGMQLCLTAYHTMVEECYHIVEMQI
jgi:hypothetical protein